MMDTASVIFTPLPSETGAVEKAPLSPRQLESTSQQTLVFPSMLEIAEVRRDEAPTIPGATAPGSRASNRLFGRYVCERELGRGGMGVVWLAHDVVLGIPVALKLVPEALTRSQHELEGLRKEVLRGIALTDPGIVRVYSFERDANSAAIVMEYVDGESLSEWQARQQDNCLDPEQLRPWLEQLCAVLDYAHGEARIVHRDLKPRNLMINSEGRLKVADFGIASSLNDATGGISVRHDTSGTPPYMSPQQAMGERPSISDDIYSVGATLYDLLTSKPPFFRGNIIAQVLQELPPPVNQRRTELGIAGRPEVSAQWERMIAACLAKDPSKRPPSGASLLQLLDTSPHAMVPYGPREEIPMESLRLDLSLAVRPSVAPEAEEAEVQVIPAPVRRVQVLRPPEPGMLSIFAGWVGDQVMTWGSRLVYAGVIAAVGLGVYKLLHAWPAMREEARPTVNLNVNSPQVVEVRYVVQAPPPPMMPPPGFMPPPPPPHGPGPGPMGPPPRR